MQTSSRASRIEVPGPLCSQKKKEEEEMLVEDLDKIKHKDHCKKRRKDKCIVTILIGPIFFHLRNTRMSAKYLSVTFLLLY